MGENENMGIETADKKGKGGNNTPKVIIGAVVIIAVAVYLLYRFIGFTLGLSSTQYEETLARYLKAVAVADTNTVKQIEATNFVNELGNLPLAKGNFELYSYTLENHNSTNEAIKGYSLLVSILLSANNTKVCYLADAYFVMDGMSLKLARIKRMQEGKYINIPF